MGALWCCDIAEAPGHSFHEPGGTGLLQLAGEDGDWFLAFVFLADFIHCFALPPFSLATCSCSEPEISALEQLMKDWSPKPDFAALCAR